MAAMTAIGIAALAAAVYVTANQTPDNEGVAGDRVALQLSTPTPSPSASVTTPDSAPTPGGVLIQPPVDSFPDDFGDLIPIGVSDDVVRERLTSAGYTCEPDEPPFNDYITCSDPVGILVVGNEADLLANVVIDTDAPAADPVNRKLVRDAANIILPLVYEGPAVPRILAALQLDREICGAECPTTAGEARVYVNYTANFNDGTSDADLVIEWPH